MIAINDIGKYLKEHGVKPSIQRVMIFDYLKNTMNHPTTDQIFTALSPDIPTLSKTTVYNTLHLFYTKGIVNLINIEDNELRYDLEINFHGHFKCRICGAITDFKVDKNKIFFTELEDYKITESHFYMKGICKNCQTI